MSKGSTRNYYNNMSQENYVKSMGGSASNLINNDSGINHPNAVVYRYFNMLRDYTLNRYEWHSDILSPSDLQLIEWLFFMTGRACIIYPTFYSRNNSTKGIKIKRPFIFNTNITLQNMRTSEPLKINIIDSYVNALFMPLKRNYNFTEFGMLSSNYTHFPANNIPMWYTAHEFANKLYEYDLTFNANATKQRLPGMIDNGVVESDKKSNDRKNYNIGNFTTGDLIRDALSRNEQLIEIPSSQLGKNGILHHTNQFNENNLHEYLAGQRKLIDEYLESIGVEILQEKHGVYQAVEVQEMSLGNNNYKATVGLRNRRYHANEVNKKFDLDLTCNLVDYRLRGN